MRFALNSVTDASTGSYPTSHTSTARQHWKCSYRWTRKRPRPEGLRLQHPPHRVSRDFRDDIPVRTSSAEQCDPFCSFYVAYIVFELPCQMLTKLVSSPAHLTAVQTLTSSRRWWGPGKTLPIFGFLFGLFSFVMAFVHTFGAAVAVRFRDSRFDFNSANVG